MRLNGGIGDWFRTTAGVRKGRLLSPTLFYIFLQRIKTDALEDHQGTVGIGDRTSINLRFAHDIDCLAGKEEELQSWTKSWDTFAFLGVFQFTQAQPLPSPHKQCWEHVSMDGLDKTSALFGIEISAEKTK